MSSGDWIRENFRKRFEPAGQDLIYRAAPGAAGIALTLQERRDIDADLDLDVRRIGVLANGWLLLSAVLAPPLLLSSIGTSVLVQFAAFLSMLAAVMYLTARLQDGAVKRIAGREVVDRGFSRIEVVLRDSAERSWFRILLFLLVPISSLLDKRRSHDDPASHAVFTGLAVLAASYGIIALGAKIWLAIRPSIRG